MQPNLARLQMGCAQGQRLAELPEKGMLVTEPSAQCSCRILCSPVLLCHIRAAFSRQALNIGPPSLLDPSEYLSLSRGYVFFFFFAKVGMGLSCLLRAYRHVARDEDLIDLPFRSRCPRGHRR